MNLPPEHYPHVARRRDRIEPAGDCTDEEARKRLLRLKELLVLLSHKLKRPGLISPMAIDSIGTLLCPPTAPIPASNPMAERHRALLVDAASQLDARLPKVRLQLRTHETLSVESAEKLDQRKRMACLAIKGTDEMARRLERDERALSDFTVELDDKGTSLVLREQRDPLKVLMLLTPAADPAAQPAAAKGASAMRRKVLETRLPSEQRAVLCNVFDGAGKGRLGQLRPDPLTAHRVDPNLLKRMRSPSSSSSSSKPSGDCFHMLPTWMVEHIATVGQNLLRLHVLATAAVPQGRSRMLYLDRAGVHRCNDPRFYEGREHTLIKAPLHVASSACLCGLHRRQSSAPFRAMEFRIEICGAAFERRNGRRCCPRHCGEELEPYESASFPGVCARSLKVELWCCHERPAEHAPGSRGGGGTTNGVRIDMTDLFHVADPNPAKPPRAAWMCESIRELAACACALTRGEHCGAGGTTKTMELKADMDNVMATLDRECHARGHTDARLGELDETAVWLLRRGGGSYSAKEGKIRMDTCRAMPGDPPEVGPTHGHLFKRMRT